MPIRLRSTVQSSLYLATAIWIFVMLAGARSLLLYQNTPAQAAVAPRQWPTASAIARPVGRFTLLIVAHPDCPCTHATLSELANLLAESQPQPATFILFSKPSSTPEQIRNSELWGQASSIEGVTALLDLENREADLFDAQASGQTFLYDPAGQLIFSGGITAARGHIGLNAGELAITQLLRNESAAVNATSVFGCSLHNPDSATLSKESSWKRR